MNKTNFSYSRTFNRSAGLILLLLSCVFQLQAAPGIQMLRSGPDFATTKYQQTVVDLAVKVQGGSIRHQRFLDGGIWQFNPNWTNLQLTYDEASAALPSSIKRNRYSYTKQGSQTTPTYVFDERLHIRKTDTGYRWEDRNGNWIDYNNDGYSTAYGDFNGTTAYLKRSATGVLETVEDRNHVTVLTYHYGTHGWLDRVEDYSGREVVYQYQELSNVPSKKLNFRGAVIGGKLLSVTDVRGEVWQYGYGSPSGYYQVVTSVTDPNGHVTTMTFSSMTGGSGSYSQPYVCVDWAGGQWVQDEQTGSWGFAGYNCLKKVQQAGFSDAFSGLDSPASTDWQYASSPDILTDISDEVGLIAHYGFRYNTTKKTNITTFEDGDHGLRVMTYNDKGEIIREISNGRLTATQDISGNTRTIYDENGNKTIIQRDSFRNPIKVTYADGSSSTLRWDSQTTNLTQVTDENGNSQKLDYTNGLLTQLQRAVGKPEQQITLFGYDSENNLASIQQPVTSQNPAATTQLEYDGNGNITKITDPESNVIELKDHDILGNPKTLIDARGNTWLFTYDAVGNPLTQTTPLGHLTQYRYDKAGNLDQVTDANNKITKLEYDARNRLIKITDPLNATATLGYNGRNMLTSVTDSLNHSIQYHYNLDGQLDKVIDGNGNEISLDYGYLSLKKFKGLVNKINYPTYQQNLQYDTRNRLTQRSDQAEGTQSRTTLYDYDKTGNLKTLTHADGLSSQYSYDALNRLTDFTDAASQLTQMAYDERDQLTQVTNANGDATWRYEYDQNGRLKTEKFADDATYTASYDGNDNLITQTDAKGQVSQYAYDKDNRLITTRYFTDATAAQNNANAQKTVSFSYDKLNRLKTYDDGQTQGSYNYDDAGRLIDYSVNYGSFTKTASYTYYPNGLKKTWTGPDGQTISYGYDNNNQLQTVSIPGQGSITVNQYNWAAPQTITFPGGGKQNNSYDGYLRTTGIKTTDTASNTLLDYNYQFDTQDNITSRNVLTGSAIGETLYDYDAMERLSHYAGPGINPNTVDLSYDPAGNRTSDSRSQNNWQYDNRDRLISRDELTYSYDANGSQTQITHATNGVEKTFIYNLENRLSEVKDGSNNTIASYQYDPFGRRISKTANGNTTTYFYAQEGLVAEMDNAGNVTTSYGYQPDSTWGTDPLYIKQGNQFGYYHNDHLGTPQQIATASGQIIWSASYDAFGEATISQQTITNNLRFPGQYYDSETGLHYNNQRYYDPGTGRYITSDPIGLAGGVNSYSYVGANPVNAYDPMGLLEGHSYRDNPLDILFDAWSSPYEWATGHKPEINQGVVDYSAAVGDRLTSGFGLFDTSLTEMARKGLGVNDMVNKCSNAYRYGQNTVDIVSLAAGGAGAARLALSKAGRVVSVTKRGDNILYQKVGPNGEHLKFGITKNPATRYTQKQLGGGRLKEIARGSKKDMLALERKVHKKLPIGPEEGQKSYIKIQVEQGLKPPPYGN